MCVSMHRPYGSSLCICVNQHALRVTICALTLVCACDFQSLGVPMRQLLLVINFPAFSEMGSLTHRGVLRWGPLGPTLTHIDRSTLLPLKAVENS